MDGRCWDEDALQQNLLPFDAEAARRIPLGRVQEDFWAWSGEKHGLYYVKSAYKLLSSRAQQARAHTAGTSSHSAAAKDQRWVKLRKQKVPPKVRVFWWRVMNDYMPCKANLYRRHVDQVASCELCGASEDTTYHVLIQCSFAHSFRRKLKNTEGIKLPKLRSRTWPEDLLDDRYCCEKDRVIILCGMWSLWNSRNDLHHARKPIEHTRAIDWAVDACFCLLTSQPPPNKTPRLNGQQWSSPPEGVLKINCDGGFQAEHMSRSIGVVMRNSEGSFIGASGRRLPSISSVLVAEAEACRDGLRLAMNNSGVRRLVMETDSLLLVSLWNFRRQQRSEIAVILDEMEVMASSLASFFFVHVKRSASMVAHLCAKHASQSRSIASWLDDPPSFILSSLQRNCNPLNRMKALSQKKKIYDLTHDTEECVLYRSTRARKN